MNLTEEHTTPGAMQIILHDAAQLARLRSELAGIVNTLNEALADVRADHMPAARAKLLEAEAVWKRLEAAITANPQLFVKPRTVVQDGIKVGLTKAKGTMVIADPDKTVAAIERQLPEQAAVLIDTRKVPRKDALAALPAATLRKLGVELQDAGDAVVIKPVEGETLKQLRALLGETETE